MRAYAVPVVLLIMSNVFMTFAWYGHLKSYKDHAIWVAVLVSWGIAFFEYCFQVPANRMGYEIFSLPQLKMLQEIITLCVFLGFSIFYMGVKPSLNFIWAALCMVGAVYFVFKD